MTLTKQVLVNASSWNGWTSTQVLTIGDSCWVESSEPPSWAKPWYIRLGTYWLIKSVLKKIMPSYLKMDGNQLVAANGNPHYSITFTRTSNSFTREAAITTRDLLWECYRGLEDLLTSSDRLWVLRGYKGTLLGLAELIACGIATDRYWAVERDVEAILETVRKPLCIRCQHWNWRGGLMPNSVPPRCSPNPNGEVSTCSHYRVIDMPINEDEEEITP